MLEKILTLLLVGGGRGELILSTLIFKNFCGDDRWGKKNAGAGEKYTKGKGERGKKLIRNGLKCLKIACFWGYKLSLARRI